MLNCRYKLFKQLFNNTKLSMYCLDNITQNIA